MDLAHATSDPQRRSAWLAGFVLVNALLAVLIAAGNIPLADTRWTWPSALFLAAALPGHLVFFGLLLGAPAWLLGRVLRNPRWMMACALVLQTLWICVVLADAKVFAMYRFHLNAMVLNMLFGGALRDQVMFSPGMWALIALSVAALIALEVTAAWLLWRRLARRPALIRIRHAWWAAVFTLVVGQGVFAYYEARGDRLVTSQLAYIPWMQPVTMKTALRRLGVQVVETVDIPGVAQGQLGYPRRPLHCARAPSLNVLVIVVESLRADALDPQTMPNTWGYAQRGQWFTHHYSTGNATRFGLFGLMYGLPGGYWHAMLAERRGPVLIDRLQNTGYRMHIYGSAPLYSPEFDRTAFTEVREHVVNAPRGLSRDAGDRHIVSRLEADIRNHPHGQHFFGFVFLDAPHAPYHLPQGFVSPFQPMASEVNFLKLRQGHDPTPERNRYRAAVHYSDQLIGELLTTLQASALADNTVVVITGDHGEEFNDLGLNYWTHNGNFSDYQLHTPFVLLWPGRPARRDARLSSHEDLVPTLMRHALGCDSDIADYSTGYDLFDSAPASRPLIAETWVERGIRDGARIYLFGSFGAPRVVDLRYREIPGAKADPEVVKRSWEMLTRFQKQRLAVEDCNLNQRQPAPRQPTCPEWIASGQHRPPRP